MAHGVAGTGKLEVSGTQAAVQVEGRLDAVHETQDPRVVVVPVIGTAGAALAVAAVDPIAGLGTLLAGTRLRQPSTAAATGVCSVRGAWDARRSSASTAAPPRPATALHGPFRENDAMKIAAVQMVSTPDVERNLDAAAQGVSEAAAAGARLVALPEYFCLMGSRDGDKLRIAEAPGDGPIQQRLSALARQHAVWLLGGTLPLATGTPGRIFNSTLAYGPDGALLARYDKMHLFNFDNGRERYDEAAVLDPGSTPVAVQAGPLRVGLSVCYDLRFPELYRALMQPPCDVLSVPSAFTYTTGQAHWELLLRARAVENQCYVLAAAQGGLHENGRRTWGHSMIVDPWGEVLDQRAEGEGLVIAEVDPARLASVRTQLPALRHRRL